MKRSWQFRWRAIGMRTPRKLTSTCRFQQQERGPYQVDGPFRCSGDVEAIVVHHLGPCRHEVFRKLLLRVRARIDFREST